MKFPKGKIPPLFWNSLIYVGLGFLPLSTNFILAPIYTQYLPKYEYGILGLAGILHNLLLVFIAMGLSAAVSRHYFTYIKSSSIRHALYSTVILLVILIALVLLLILNIFGEDLLDLIFVESFSFGKYGIWVFVSSFCLVLNTLLISFYRNEENIKLFALVTGLYFLGNIIGNLYGLIYYQNAYGVINGRALGGLISTVPVVIWFISRGGLIIKSTLFKSLFKFALPLIPYGFLMVFYENLDRLIIQKVLSLEDLGLYTLAYQIAGVVSVIIFSLYNAYSPLINRLLNNEILYKEEIIGLNKTFTIVCLLIISMAIAAINPLANFLIDEQYYLMLNYVPILMAAYVGRIFYMEFSLRLLFEKKTKSLNWITMISLGVGAIFVLFTYQDLGILSVCYFVVIVKLVQAVAAFMYLRYYSLTRHYNQYNWVFVSSVMICVIPLFYSQIKQQVFYNNLFNLIPIILLSTILITKRKQINDWLKLIKDYYLA